MTTRTLAVPDLSLLVLIGTTGSGKSTFAREHFRATEVVSSDACRGMVADDENDQSASADAFAVLHYIVGKRLAAGRLTVVDATNVQSEARRQLVDLAREHDVLPVAVVLDTPEATCRERNALRPDRADLPAHVLPRQRRELRRSLRGLERQGFRRVHVLRDVEETAAARIVRERRYNDLRHLTGPFDLIGDVHGCRAELETLLTEGLGYPLRHDDRGRAVSATHPAGRTAVFVGDLVDRGPDSPGVLRLVMGMVEDGTALCVPGNHENKFGRWLKGRKVQHRHGLVETVEQFERVVGEEPEFAERVRAFVDSLVSHYVLDGGGLVVCHAGLPEKYHGRTSGRVRSHARYGETTGETDEFGLPVRYPWAEEYRGRAAVIYGHTPVPRAEWVNNTLCLDTGCVFGGAMTALRWPEREIVDTPAERVWYEPVRPLVAEAPGGVDGRPLDLTDVQGRRVVETRHMGRLAVREENAAAALEVMSRFATDPRALPYLPPTMAPCATARADGGGRMAGEGYLEHPVDAFADYRKDGVRHVVCEEKHMGSRVVALVCRDAAVARERFGVAGEVPGALYTRTRRPFLGADTGHGGAGALETTARVLGRIARCAEDTGLWEELGTDWMLLDTELMPWSLKAAGLLRSQYASVGAAAGAALPDALQALERAGTRGVDTAELLGRQRERAADASAFTAAYRRYCWPVGDRTRGWPGEAAESGKARPVVADSAGGVDGLVSDGLDGIRIAPFQVLATEGHSHATLAHDRQLELMDRLIDAERAMVERAHPTPEGRESATPGEGRVWWNRLLATTRRQYVDTHDEASVTEGVRWWPDLTESGGEGMVAKPLEPGPRKGDGGLVQPGVKCRGREYLRIVYGPEYTRPDNLARLRERSLGHKRSLALREYALGLEALDRLAEGEPLWRVHEAVFAVLALESEPVDPRL
ncbi:polynucleotide kinase-phosphatase [Streptomyces oceani]|uniref:Polynucleotide kinase-phosphatase n=1 Tax=Streptomyces oceani TaxID=1075402 RepID=A0A1E7KKV8_9ACTN|nr:polynucleotide kinase-phosphatase [Streptomyces oceani]OEV04526.1 polynucleotide kinase-phosphatase [Streptomyces oceani]